eukprot:1138221-Pelagomonas_calceolata.AAC.1
MAPRSALKESCLSPDASIRKPQSSMPLVRIPLVRLPIKTPTEVRGVSGLGTGAAPKALAAGVRRDSIVGQDEVFLGEVYSSCWKHSVGITPDGRLLTWGWNGAYNEDSWLMVGVMMHKGCRKWLLRKGDSGSGQLGQGDNHDRWDPALVQRLHTSSKRFYDLRMSYIKPWKALQDAHAQVSTHKEDFAVVYIVWAHELKSLAKFMKSNRREAARPKTKRARPRHKRAKA